MRKESFDAAIANLFARQFSVVSREQLLELGATDGIIRCRVESGRWQRVHRGVYRLSGATATWYQSLMAACLACGRDAVASHAASATLLTLPGFARGTIHVSSRRTGRSFAGVLVHRVVALPQVDVTSIRGIPSTTAARTLIDLAAIEPRGVVEEALDDALRRKLVSLARLRWRLTEIGGSGRQGSRLIRELLDARQPGESVPQSVFETRLLRALKSANLPTPGLQYEVRDGGRLVAVVDFAFPWAKLAIEADGERWHSGRSRWARDLARGNALVRLGWRVIHVTWEDLTLRRRDTIDTIRAALEMGVSASTSPER